MKLTRERMGARRQPSHAAPIRAFVLCSVALAGARGPAGASGTEAWSALPNMPVPRWEAGTVVLDDRLYVFGGYTVGTRSSRRADVFDPVEQSWTKLADLPSAITHMNTVLDGRLIWFAGGFKDGYKGHAITEVWRYDVDEDAYTAAPPLPEPRAGGGLALVGRRLHYIGGLLPDRLTDAPDHWVLDLDEVATGAGSWKAAPPLPEPRNQFGTVSVDGKIYAMGGQFGHDRGQIDQARVDVYDPSTQRWTRAADLPKGHSHAEGSTFVHGGTIYMMGGMTRVGRTRRIDDAIWSLSPGGTWEILGTLPRALSSPAAAIIGDRLFVAGGSLDGRDPQPGMWVRSAPGNSVGTERWPGWLGPDRNGWVSGFQPPASWPDRLEERWRVTVGAGYGSPLVSDGRVYQHARQENEEVVWCLRLESGDVEWRKSYLAPFKMGGGGERHGKGPKSCPVLADGRLFTLSITGVLTAWDAGSGERLWRRDYGPRFKSAHPYWGVATSPIVDGDRVIVHLGTDDEGALVAFDVESGNEVWRQGKDGASYSSPLVVELHGVRQIVEWNHRALAGVETSSGRLLWEFEFPHVGNNQNMPTPAVHRGRVLVGGENRGVHSIEPRLENGVWTATRRWSQKNVALDMSSAVVNDDLLFGFSHYRRGQLFCLDPETGDIRWQGPGRTGENVMFLAFPGHVAALLDGGELRVIRASGDQLETVASYRVSENPTWAPPVILRGGVLVKDTETLTYWSW